MNRLSFSESQIIVEKRDYAEQVGQAWLLYRNGQNDAAAKGFEDVLSRDAENIDAAFGLGLVRRSQGSLTAAQTLFEKARDLVDQALTVEPNKDRWEILKRMIQQRLAETQSVAR